MEVPKNAFACAICQKTFTNPAILIKHVEFRHSSTKQSPKYKVGPEPKDKDPINNVNEDPLETNSASYIAPFEFIQPLQNVEEITGECVRLIEITPEEINQLNGNCPTYQAQETIKVEDVNFEDRILPSEERNSDNPSKNSLNTQNDALSTQNQAILTHKSSVKSVDNVVNINESKKLDILETNATITRSEHGKPENIFKQRISKAVDVNCDSDKHFIPDVQSHNGIQLRQCSVEIQKLPKKFDELVKRMRKVEVCNKDENSWQSKETSKETEIIYSIKGSESVHPENSNNIKSYSCGFCDKKFSFASELKRHERVHTGEKPYDCKYCDKKFNQSHHLKDHERTHTGEKPYSCKFCDKTFTQSGSVKKHERTHTGEKPYSCNIGDKKFKVLDHLKAQGRIHSSENQSSHLKDHESEKPYSCKYCNQKCTPSYSVKKHERIHGGEQPFSCTNCGQWNDIN